ncbi:Transmembrane emp24 domain-containing protein 3 [Fukomys damarensis]|uniref:Transmembrane emp24 domain-containing protein 3 n=2 Tax=Fukomys damarensis TaxID=885580 RepID=A0A091E4P6_FUKDA|nr:Transmembrane emp24 domain-containing protein 3 [Fukomys damarensis]
MGNKVTALTQMESACVTIHEALKTVIDSQTHYRLREAQDRARAEDLNSRVSYWSIGETIALFVVSFSQVLLLKSFFTEKRPAYRAVHS